MKILVLESSGNKRGSSNLLAEAFIRGAEENGHEVTEFDVIRVYAGVLLQLASTAENGHRPLL